MDWNPQLLEVHRLVALQPGRPQAGQEDTRQQDLKSAVFQEFETFDAEAVCFFRWHRRKPQPVSKWALILGKLLPYSIIGIGQTLFVLLLMRYVFLIPIEGDLALLMSLSILFLLPALSMGILVSTVSHTQAQATQIGLLVMLPSVLLSGFAFPRETMPLPIYLITFLIPVTYYVQILRGIILRGADFLALWPQTAALAAFTVVLVVLSSLRFQKRMG